MLKQTSVLTPEQLVTILKPDQIEFVYRHQQREYLKKDAARHLAEHLMEYLDYQYDEGDFDAETLAVELLAPLDKYLGEAAELFLKYKDCNQADNDTWQFVVDYLSPHSDPNVCFAWSVFLEGVEYGEFDAHPEEEEVLV